MSNDQWFATQDNMPGAVALRVSGTVTVPASNYSATLTRYEGAAPFDKALRLSLNVTAEDTVGLAVLTEREVTFTIPGTPDHPYVHIYNGHEIIASMMVTPAH